MELIFQISLKISLKCWQRALKEDIAYQPNAIRFSKVGKEAKYIQLISWYFFFITLITSNMKIYFANYTAKSRQHKEDLTPRHPKEFSMYLLPF